MKKWMLLMFLTLVVRSACASGFVLTWENDSFMESDDDYTHGMDLFYIDESHGTNYLRTSWGYRLRMYSPDNITVSELQPLDRPWCGVSTVVRQWWKKEGKETVLYEIEVGVLGPASGAEYFQKEIHKIIGSKEPKGWDNQLPDEPVVNGYMERRYPVVSVGKPEEWRACFDAVYGGALGTTFVDGMGGMGAKAGWNIPQDHFNGMIGVKNFKKWRPFVYGFIDERAYLVAHNSTLANSLFHDDRDGTQELELIVVEDRYGISFGVNGFAITYAQIERSDEYVGQTDDTDYGMLSFEFGMQF